MRNYGPSTVSEPMQPMPSSLERRIQSVLQSVMLAILLGAGVAVVDMRERLARMETKNDERSHTYLDLRAADQAILTQLHALQNQVAAATVAAASAATAAANAASVATRK